MPIDEEVGTTSTRFQQCFTQKLLPGYHLSSESRMLTFESRAWQTFAYSWQPGNAAGSAGPGLPLWPQAQNLTGSNTTQLWASGTDRPARARAHCLSTDHLATLPRFSEPGRVLRQL